MKYNLNPIQVAKEAARFDTCYRFSGGFNLVDDKLVVGSYLPSLAPISIDFTTRRAVAVKNVEVAEDFTSGGTSLKIKKESLAYVGMHIGNGTKGGTISAIDKSSADYDILTVSAIAAALTKGTVLFEASAVGGTTQKNKANALNYAVTKVEDGAVVDAIGSIYEIQPSKLPIPFSAKDKTDLGARFLFTL
ncbi:MAG: head fiber protein [Rikenellaceae bacterium]